MKKKHYKKIENYMLSLMSDSAHDCQHIYRVLFYALEISRDYTDEIDEDVLIAAALLHDIGRNEQYRDKKVNHAIAGGDMAYKFLKSIGWEKKRAKHVRNAIYTHRYRKNEIPETIEAKILYDADKLDVTGAIGIARTIAYESLISEPFYSVKENKVLSGEEDKESSFFKEYNFKLKKIYDSFYTEKAKKMSHNRKISAEVFYDNMYREAIEAHEIGENILNKILE